MSQQQGASSYEEPNHPNAPQDEGLWQRIAAVLDSLATHARVPGLIRNDRTRLETLLITLVTGEGDAIDLLDPQPPSATLATKLGYIADKLRSIRDDIPPVNDLIPLNGMIAISLLSSLIDLHNKVTHLAKIANERKVPNRPRKIANDHAINQLAKCWRIATGALPKPATRQKAIENSYDGAIEVLDKGPFAQWAVLVLQRLRPEHPAAKDRKAPIADAIRRLRKDKLFGEVVVDPTPTE